VSSIIRRRAAIATSTNNVVTNDTVAAPEPPPALAPDPVPDPRSLEPRTSEHAQEETIVTAAVLTNEGSTPINTPAQTLDRAVATPKVRASALTTSTESHPPAKAANAKAKQKAAPKQIARARPADPWFPGLWPNRSQNRKDNWIFPGNSEPLGK
jgi:hypothetical protein